MRCGHRQALPLLPVPGGDVVQLRLRKRPHGHPLHRAPHRAAGQSLYFFSKIKPGFFPLTGCRRQASTSQGGSLDATDWGLKCGLRDVGAGGGGHVWSVGPLFAAPPSSIDLPSPSLSALVIYFSAFFVSSFSSSSSSSHFHLNSSLPLSPPQVEFFKADMAALNRTATPWLLVALHRPLFGSELRDQ